MTIDELMAKLDDGTVAEFNNVRESLDDAERDMLKNGHVMTENEKTIYIGGVLAAVVLIGVKGRSLESIHAEAGRIFMEIFERVRLKLLSKN